MNNQAAQTMPELPDPAFVTPDDNLYTVHQMRAMYQQGYAAALAQTEGVPDGWMRDVADAAASLDKHGDHQMAARLMRLHRDMLAAAPAASGGVDYDEVWLLLKSAQTNIGACRPDWDADDAEHWDRLTAAMESVKAASIKQPGSINRPLVSDDSQDASASVSERARELLVDEYMDSKFAHLNAIGLCIRDGSLDNDTAISLALRAIEQALTQQRGECEAVDSDAWADALELPEGYTVEEFLPGGWHYAWTRADGECMVSGTTWNHPALAAIAAWQYAPATTPSDDGGEAVAQYTTGHCEYHKQPGGCPHHNLQCGWPNCDRRPK